MKLAWRLKGGAQVAPWPNSYHRENPADKSQEGDVISVQPDGSIQTRSKDAIGPWEKCTLNGACLVYTVEGTTFVFIPDEK